MRYLSIEDILRLHFEVIEDYGGSHGIREEGRLLAVVDAPQQAVFGEEQYKTIYEKAAVYYRNIIADHAFIDGNKRTATTCTAVFLQLNGYKLTASPKVLEDFAVQIATDHLEIKAIAEWLEKYTIK